jgi:NADP-dependent 3-hydroxy acid dehydrogenase YdfG
MAAAPSGMAMAGLGRDLVHVVDGGSGLAEAVAGQLAAAGVRSVAVRQPPPDARAVVLLDGLAPVDGPRGAASLHRAAFQQAREVAPGMTRDGALFVVVQDTGGDFGLSGRQGVRAWAGGLAALARTAAKEWPMASVKTIDCERGDRDDAAVATAIAAELLAGGPTAETGLRADGTRLVLIDAQAPLPAERGRALPPGDRSVIVVTGGARGVTAAALTDLAATYRPRIAILGRTPLAPEPPGLDGARDEASLIRLLAAEGGGTPARLAARARAVLAAREVRQTLARLAKAGAQARYFAADAADVQAVRAALAEVRALWGPVTGLVHAAGVLADKNITDKTDAQFDRVFAAKVTGLAALLDATRDDPVELICLFSSVAARYGNPGQCDYAMANEVLNQVAAAEQAARPGCVVRSVCWGPWNGGMVTPALAAHFASQAVPLIPPGQGAAAFTAELGAGRGETRVVVSAGQDWPRGIPRLRAQVAVSAVTHGHLTDHSIAGIPVLPLAMALEWFAAMASAWHPAHPVVVLKEVSVLRKVALTGLEEGCTLRVEGEPCESGLSLTLLGDGPAPRYRAKAEKRTPGTTAWPEPDGLASVEYDTIYHGPVSFHGPRFQSLRAVVRAGIRGASAGLAGLTDLGWTGTAWHTDPAATDAALQLATVWAHQESGGGWLPMGVEEFRLHSRGPVRGPARCLVRGRESGTGRASCDAVILGAGDVPVAELTGISLIRRPDLP